MFDKQDKAIHYKWNQKTGTGFSLRLDASSPERVGARYQVEDLRNHVVTDAWGCESLDEALGVLKRFFDIDVSEERHRIEGFFPQGA